MPLLYRLANDVSQIHVYGTLEERQCVFELSSGTAPIPTLENWDPVTRRSAFERDFGYETAVELWLDPGVRPRPPLRIPRYACQEEKIALGEHWAIEDPEHVAAWLEKVHTSWKSSGWKETPYQRKVRRRRRREWIHLMHKPTPIR